jgi:hypothetical protein
MVRSFTQSEQAADPVALAEPVVSPQVTGSWGHRSNREGMPSTQLQTPNRLFEVNWLSELNRANGLRGVDV